MGFPTRTVIEESGRRSSGGAGIGRALIIGLCSAGDLMTPLLKADSAAARATFGKGELLDEFEAFLTAGGQDAMLVRVPEDTAGTVGAAVLEGTGEATAVAAGTPTYPADIAIKCVTAGACATAEIRISYDGGQSYGAKQTTPASTVALDLTNGATITWTNAGTPADSFDVDDVWWVKVLPGLATNAAILQALSVALQEVYNDWRQVIISPQCDVTLYAALDALMDTQFESGDPKVIIVNTETFSEYMIDNIAVTGLDVAGTGAATGTAVPTITGLPFGDGNFRKVIAKVTTGGAFATAEIALSYDEGLTYGTPFKPVAGTKIFLDGLNMTLAFAAGAGPDFVINETYEVGDDPEDWSADLKSTWLTYRSPWVHTAAQELWLANSYGSSYIARPAGLTMGAYCSTKLGYSPANVENVSLPASGYVGPFTEMEGQYEAVLGDLLDSLFLMWRYESGFGFTVAWGVSRDVDGSIHDIVESVLVNAHLTASIMRQMVIVTGMNLSAPGAFGKVINAILAGGSPYEKEYAIHPGSFVPIIYSTVEEIRSTRLIQVGWSYKDTALAKNLQGIVSVSL